MPNTAAPHLDDQPTLFDIHPEGTEPPVAQRAITPGSLLPAPSQLFVDVERVCTIFDVGVTTVIEMLRTGMLKGYQLQRGSRWNIAYDSIVEFCDELRLKNHIRDRRPKLAPGRRWRDADLLPFATSDTVSVPDVMTGLEVPKRTVLHLIEEGAFEAYRIFESSPWRISKTSLFEYRDRKRAQLTSNGFQGRPPRRTPKR